MRYGYMIYSIVEGGYYDNHSKSFRGILYGTCYKDAEHAEHDVITLPKGWYRVDKILINK